jgi:membrane-bound lytic murein transglycosylase F
MPLVDWRVFKAQCFAESSFRPSAISPVGAAGMCQIMPNSTWKDLEKYLQIFGGNIFDPKLNIQFGAAYMKLQRAKWTSPRPEFHRHSLAMASYNAGFGNIYSAQKRCNMSIFYDSIIKCLPEVTGNHSKETTDYVSKIWKFYILLLGI